MKIIGVCGYSGAGKSTFCQEMARRFQLPVLSTGEIVRQRVVERGYPLTPESIARVSDEIRLETGGRFLLVLAPQLARALAASRVVIVDCLREESDVMALRELGYRLALVAIDAGEAARIARAQARGREGDPVTTEGLRTLDERERRLGVDRLVAGADHQVANDGELGGLRQPRGRCGHRDPRRLLSQPTEQARPATVASCEERSDKVSATLPPRPAAGRSPSLAMLRASSRAR